MSVFENPENATDALDRLNFDEFCELLMPLGALNSPSELHGFLCGKLCGGATLTLDEWSTLAWDLLDIAETPDAQALEHVKALYVITHGQLNSGDYDLQPFLPDDDSDLEERTQALSQWCHGFLSGFGSSGIDPDTSFSSDQADSLRDMAAIVQVTIDGDLDDGDDRERGENQQESDYFDLIEYVRVVAMNFYEDKLQGTVDNESAPSPSNVNSIDNTIH